jgi:hypothetical protein
MLVTVLIAGATFVTAVAQRSARPRTEPAQLAVMTTAGADEGTGKVVLPYVEQHYVDNSTPVPTVAPTPNLPDLSVVAQVGGTAWDVALAGKVAFVTAGTVVKTFDVANPARPRALGQSAPLPGLAMGLAVADDYLYVALSPGEGAVGDLGGLAVMDLADPAHPRLERMIPMVGGAADVVVDTGHSLFVLATNPWLRYAINGPDPSVHILDRSDPVALRELANIRIGHDSEHGQWQLAVDGNRLYAGDETYDVTDPSSPESLGGRRFGGGYSVAARGGLVASTGGDWPTGSWTTDILVSGPVMDGTPLDRRSTSCRDGSATTAVTWLRDGLLAIGDGGGCTVVVPELGELTTFPFQVDGHGTAITVQDEVAFVAHHGEMPHFMSASFAHLTGGGGLMTVDVAAPGPPQQMAVLDGPAADASAVAVSGDTIYLLEGRHGGRDGEPARLWALDAHDAASPIPLGSAMTVGVPQGLAVDERNGYVATTAGLEVFDLSDPHAPRALGRAGTSMAGTQGPSMRVLTRGGYVYVPRFGLKRFDVRDPQRPKQDQLPEDSSPPPSIVDDMALADGSLAFVIGDFGVVPIELTPNGYEALAPAVEMSGVFSVCWSRGYLFVLRQTYTDAPAVLLEVLDAADPTNLHVVSTPLAMPWVTNPIGTDEPARIVADDGRLTIIDISGRVSIIDISDPIHPRIAGKLVSSDYDRAVLPDLTTATGGCCFITFDAVAFGNYILRARQPGGLEILRLEP